jgi:ADP-ribosylglycohydrolase
MKAWEMEKELIETSKPRVLSDEEQTWDAAFDVEKNEDFKTRLLWKSEVPGSAARERVIIGAIQDVENRGMDVEAAEKLIPLGLKALEENNMVELNKITARVFYELNNAEKNINSPYWNYTIYSSWDQFKDAANPIETIDYDIYSKGFEGKTYSGWLAQIVGGAIDTAIEGYTSKNLKEAFGDIRNYVRKPNTYNDDITYELAFLKAFEHKGYNVTSADIAEAWVGYVPFGWSAEEVALKNIKYGIYPPESGHFNNPYYEWIGAQMRGAICGMVSPGNPMEAAHLAWIDGVVSHYNNGVIGEIFNAVLVSLSYVKSDIREILVETIEMLPKTSEYYSVVKFALDKCKACDNWTDAWAYCEKRYERYNWIHAYPNAAAEVVALWYGRGDFDETMYIISMEGQDVDCNAAQIASALGIISSSIDKRWTDPIGDELNTYIREIRKIKITELAKWTVDVTRRAYKGA